MRIIRKGCEKEIVCPKCKSLLYYVNSDIHLIGDMEGEYNYCVKCQECGKQIIINKHDKHLNYENTNIQQEDSTLKLYDGKYKSIDIK